MKDELTNHLVSVSKDVETLLNNLIESYKKRDKKLSEKNKEIFNRLKNICNVKHINAHQALFGFYFGCDLKSIPLISARNVSRLKEVIDNCNTILDKQDIEYLLKERFH